MSDVITMPVLFVKPVFRVDGSVKLEFDTRELSGVDIAVLADYRMKEGWLLFAANKNELKETDIPDEKADPLLATKTPSRRLRDRLFIYYAETKKGEKHKFNQWYESELDRIGQVYLEKVND